ncbi:MAG: hypothetical protein M1368_03640 [Thaumarchaeota archaeon]|nr:hypothetical protein [Nitrososphaerota archaeon]
MVTLKKVSLGTLVAENVEAAILELEYPRLMISDAVLGRTFLKNFKLSVDVGKGSLSLNPIAARGQESEDRVRP